MVDPPKLEVLAAVDVVGGRAVRPSGAAAAIGPEDPIDAARRLESAGASWIHLVDVDAACGRGSNHDVLASVVATLEVDVQWSGGICDEASLAGALRAGAQRYVISAAALADPAWVSAVVQRHGERVAVGLDVRGDRLRPRGTDRDVGELWATLAWLDAVGCARYVVTDVDADGAMRGPNLDLLRAVCERTAKPVIASGGVATLEDLRALRALAPGRVEGAIVGTALAAGAFTVEQAMAILRA